MKHYLARTLFFAGFTGLVFGLVAPGHGAPAAASRKDVTAPSDREKVVFLAGDIGDDNLVVLGATLAASGHPGTLLLDSARTNPHQKVFLQTFQPEQVIPVGSFPDGIADLERRLQIKAAPVLPWRHGRPVALWKALFPRAERVVVCPEKPRGQLLQAACLAGVLHAPLYVTHGKWDETADLGRWLGHWQTQKVYVIGSSYRLCPDLSGVQAVRLKDEEAVAASCLRHRGKHGPVRTLVVANPADVQAGPGAMSSLAPWIALQRHAVLLLTNPKGDNVATLVKTAVKRPGLTQADTLLLVADLEAIPMVRRPNPVPGGKDPYIEMEPLTPTGNAAFSFATGRLFNDDPGAITLLLARQRLLAQAQGPRKALVVSNATGGLQLLETISRNTAKEFRNAGYETTTLFGKDVNKDQLRRLLPEHDIFLWEGHYNTLVKDFQVPDWTEPLPPALVFLQSCLALSESKAQPLLQRGGVGVIGSTTRIYSGSGGAFTLAFFDALLYEHRSVGGSLRQAKNFMLAYSLLKEKRLGNNAKLGAANLRSAWAFSLWGDPTLKLPPPETPVGALPVVRHQVAGNTILLTVPAATHETQTPKYKSDMAPNGRVAGLTIKAAEDEAHRMRPMLFAEIHLPHGPADTTPHLHSRLPDDNYVFCWDEWRQTGYLLVSPRAKDRGKLRFHIDWVANPEQQAVKPEPSAVGN